MCLVIYVGVYFFLNRKLSISSDTEEVETVNEIDNEVVEKENDDLTDDAEIIDSKEDDEEIFDDTSKATNNTTKSTNKESSTNNSNSKNTDTSSKIESTVNNQTSIEENNSDFDDSVIASNNDSSNGNSTYDELSDSMLTDEDFHTNEQGLKVSNDFDWDSNPISDQDAQELEGWNIIGIATEEVVQEYVSNNN